MIKASERVSPDYRMMRDGWKVRQKKQLGPPRPAAAVGAAVLSLEHGTADNVGTSEPFMFRLKVPVRAGQAPTCLTPSLPHPLTTSASTSSLCYTAAVALEAKYLLSSLWSFPYSLDVTPEPNSLPKSSH